MSSNPKRTRSLEHSIPTYADRIIFAGLIALTFLLPVVFSPYNFGFFDVPKLFLLRAVTIVIIAAWAVQKIAARRFTWNKTPVNLAWSVFLATGVAATILSLNYHTSIYGEIFRYEGLLTLANYAWLYFFALNYLGSAKAARTWQGSLLASSAVVSLVAVFQKLGLQLVGTPRAFESRSFSTFGNPLYLGAFLTLAIPLTISLLLAEIDEGNDAGSRLLKSKWFWILTPLMALQMNALFLTLARAAWLGLALSLLVLALLNRKRISQCCLRFLISLIATLIFAILFYISIHGLGEISPTTNQLSDRAISTFQITEGTAGNRIYIWRMTLPMIRERPIFGYGLDSYQIVFPKFRPADWYRTITEPAIPDKAHNDLLQVAVNQGLAGLFSYLVLLIFIFRSLISAFRRSESKVSRYLLAGVIAAAIGYFVQLQFSFSVISVAPLFWIMIGLSMSVDRDNAAEKTFEIRQLASTRLRAAACATVLILSAWLIMTIFRPFLADCYIMSGNEELAMSYFEDAAADFERAILLNPAEVRYYLFLKDAYLEEFKLTKDRRVALKLQKALRKAEQLSPYQAETYFGRGNLFKEMAQKSDRRLPKKAIVEYKRILEFDPNNADAHFNIALTSFDLRDYETAISYWRKTITLNPMDEQAHIGLGESFKLTGRFGPAKEAFQAALEINPYNPLSKKELEELSK